VAEDARLPFKRIAVTRPPAEWFHGISRTIFEIYRQAFVDLGLEVFDVPIESFAHLPDASRIPALLAHLRAFRPEVAFGLSHGLHAMACRMPAGRDGHRPNLFTDLLDIPTICCWDHAPLDMADQVLQPHPRSAGESAAGALETLRRALTHPRLIHWSRDSGQARIMRDLGFLRMDRVIHEPPPCLPGFASGEEPVESGVAFVGHFYRADDPFPELAGLTRDTIEAWLGAGGRPLWDVLMERIAGAAIDPDQTMFWAYAYRLIVHRAQSAVRLKVLGAAGVPVACYGDLPAGVPGIPENLVAMPGAIAFGPLLAAALRRHAITIDVMNPGFIHGFSHKPVLAFASGGFVLMDRKRDFLDQFGQAGAAVSYDGADDLGAKVDRFLGNPGYRREVGDAIREEIAGRFQLKDVLCRVLVAAGQITERGGRTKDDPPVIMVMDRLGIRSDALWEGSRLEVAAGMMRVCTSPQAWMYAAAIGLPPLGAMREPHLRVSIQVEQGRIGVGAMRDNTWDLVGEQLVSPTDEPITVTVELPHEGVSNVVLRNTVEGVSRVLVLEASLCDRL
jgi:hypothetical protein